MGLAPIQFDENLIAGIQMKDDTVAGVVITLVLVLGDGAGPDLEYDMHTQTRREEVKKCTQNSPEGENTVFAIYYSNIRAE